jgi:iron complex transport system ATP-binding protein
MTPSLEFRQMSFSYGRSELFREFDLRVEPGELFGVIGPNGSGKSTLLRLAAGLLRPWAGTVALNGRDISRLSRQEVARVCGVVLQEAFFAFDYLVEDVVLMGRHPHLGALEQPQRRDRELAREALEFVDAAGLARESINAISQGEKQRVLLARALCQEPDVLLLDEALSHLDISHQHAIVRVLRKLTGRGKTAVLLSHDLNLSGLFCDRLLLLDRGRAAACDMPERVLTRELVARVYGVEPLVLAHPETGRPQLLLPS